MGTTTVRIEGLEELQGKLRRLGSSVEAVLVVGATEGAKVIRDEARGRGPGPHIEVELKKSSADYAEVSIGPDDEHWYYRFFESGVGSHEIKPSKKKALKFAGREGETVRRRVVHVGMGAKPFLRPAIEAGKGAATDKVREILKRAIEAVCR